MQADDPSQVVYDPASQTSQPRTETYSPATHITQVVAPSAVAAIALSHAMQLEDPLSFCHDPAAHCIQYVEPALEYDPLAHDWQELESVSPKIVEKLPASHMVQFEGPMSSL